MATGTIAQYKIDSIAAHLVAPQAAEISKLENELSAEYTKRALVLLPTKVRECFEEHPEYMYTRNYLYVKGSLRSRNDTVHISVNLPKMANADTPPISSEDEAHLALLVNKIKELQKVRDVLRRKSICAIEKIKTYKRLQVEFPEAYKILIEKVDIGDVKDDSICDTVESLRAELGVTEKK